MRHNHSVLLFILFLCLQSLNAQVSLDSLLAKVERNSPDLVTARYLLEANQIEATTGLAPENPEVDFAWLWGTPEEIGNRMDLSVTQTVDFPTAYISRSKLSKIHRKEASLQYELRRQEIMVMARKAWLERVYLNRTDSILASRLEFARKMLDDFNRKWASGEIDRLKLNQVKMSVIALENEISLLKQEMIKNEATIMALTGDEEVLITETRMPEPSYFSFDSLIIAYRNGYSNQLYQTAVESREKAIDVAFDMKLPKLTAGYYRETILGTELEGIQAGITIPLWGNSRAVKVARAKLALAESDASSYWEKKHYELQKLYERWTNLKELTTELKMLLEEIDSQELLDAALENGEISLTDFYFESDYYYRNLLHYEKLMRDLYLLETELLRVKL